MNEWTDLKEMLKDCSPQWEPLGCTATAVHRNQHLVFIDLYKVQVWSNQVIYCHAKDKELGRDDVWTKDFFRICVKRLEG